MDTDSLYYKWYNNKYVMIAYIILCMFQIQANFNNFFITSW